MYLSAVHMYAINQARAKTVFRTKSSIDVTL